MSARIEFLQSYQKVINDADMRELALNDLFYLMVVIMGRTDMNNDFLFNRCMEVQFSPDNHIDLWAREHYKDLACDTAIATPRGWVEHGDLQVGDFVYHPSGQPTRVVATEHFTDSACFEITFSSNIKITCGAGHLWKVLVKKRSDQTKGYKYTQQEGIVQTRELVHYLNNKNEVYVVHEETARVFRILSLQGVSIVPTNCIQVESRDGMYLAGKSKIPTHNSTIITVGKTIQDILTDPELTVGIFAHTRPIAKAFLRQIMRELENNTLLQSLFPDILYEHPKRESRQWSEETGIMLKRKTNPKEATVEAWGVVDGQPTGKHFKLLVYDDMVSRESVSTTEMINKTTQAWELSLNLGSRGGRIRYIGTRYHANDTYNTIMRRGVAMPRIKPATHNGKPDGEPVFLTREELDKKRAAMGVFTFSCQMLQDPVADNAQGFKLEWLQYWSGKPQKGETDENGIPLKDHTESMNIYMFVDPASEKKKDSDYTTMTIFGLASDGNIYLIDGIRDRLNLTEKWKRLLYFHKKYRPMFVGYEKYGMQSDIEHYRTQMDAINYHFIITALGGNIAKEDRIRWLVPTMESKKFYVPSTIPYVDYSGKPQCYVQDLKDEMEFFPVSAHDDVLDCASRIHSPEVYLEFPELGDSPYDLESTSAIEDLEEENRRNPLARWLN